jgi:hypothetical protein
VMEGFNCCDSNNLSKVLLNGVLTNPTCMVAAFIRETLSPSSTQTIFIGGTFHISTSAFTDRQCERPVKIS